MEETQRCVDRCSSPLNAAQNSISQELQSMQVSIFCIDFPSVYINLCSPPLREHKSSHLVIFSSQYQQIWLYLSDNIPIILTDL